MITEPVDQILNVQDLVTLGCSLASQGREVDAERILWIAVGRDPNHVGALVSLGGVLTANSLKKYQQSEDLLNAALLLSPKERAAWFNKGRLMTCLRRFEEARACFEIVLRENPLDDQSWQNLGSLCQYTGQWKEQIGYYERAIQANPSNMQARACLGLTQMLLGQWDNGLFNYEARPYIAWAGWPLPTDRTRPIDLSLNQKPHNGEKVLVAVEQGMGDIIQFIRYGPVLHKMFPSNDFYLFCTDEQAPFLKKFPGWSGVFSPSDKDIMNIDRQMTLLSCIRLVSQGNLEKDKIIIPDPIKPDIPPLYGKWGSDRRRIGLCWRGNPKHSNDEFRSIPVEKMAPLVSGLLNYWPISLQKGFPIPQHQSNLGLVTPSGIADWTSTAAFIQHMDLVITVDTSIAHLAGTLGIRTWVLLPANPDWRWGIEGYRTPWYPSMRLVRQKTLGDWDSVIKEVRGELAG